MLTRLIQVSSPGFEPGSKAPEAPMLSRLYYEPIKNDETKNDFTGR